MRTNHKKWVIRLNVLFLLLFAGWGGYTEFSGTLSSRMRVTELDRREVFNTDRLREYDPTLGDNLRAELGPWISQKDHELALQASLLGMGIAIINIAIPLAWNREKEKKE